MTRINGTNANTCRAFAASSTARSVRGRSHRITETRSELVNDEPIEEVIFEPNSGVDQRARHRGYVITEPVEDVLVERRDRAMSQDKFWQRFSTPFMAQVIGQNECRPDPRILAYNQAPTFASDKPRHRLSRAC